MSFPGHHQHENRSSGRGRRLQRRGSSASSGRRNASADDGDQEPLRAICTEEHVESWRGLNRSNCPEVRRVASLPPDPRRPRAFPESRYHPLEEGEIRLLRLRAGNRRDKVRCEIDHMSLLNPRPYVALSYAWGDTYDKVDIELNHGVFKITRSLHGALTAVREPNEDIFVWADAVCINQDDLDERSGQVQRMYLIYREANVVGIWLGPEADDSHLAISLADKLAAEGLKREEIKRMIHSPTWERHFDALVDLFERDYWRRLWVVQEVQNAKQIVVYCGDDRTPWDRFIRVSDVLRPFEEDVRSRLPKPSRLERINYWIYLTKGGPKSLIYRFDASLDDKLGYFRSRLTADPRDKLYGLLGILPEHVRKDFTPDYETSPEKLYIDIVEYIIRKSGSLSIICESHRLSLGPNLLKLPSWVPDWSHAMSFVPLGKDSSYWRGSRFCASGAVEGDVQLLGDKRSKFQMKAIYVGKVGITGVPLANVLDRHTTLLALMCWWYIFKQLPVKDDEAFYRTITLDQINYKGWTSVLCHVIGTLATYDIPYFPSHPDLRINPSIQIDRSQAEVIFESELTTRLVNCRLFVTEKNHLGLARGIFDEGCIVCIPLGCNTPVILRPDGRDSEYAFHGDAYVDGLMYGEAIECWKRGEMKLQTYTLH